MNSKNTKRLGLPNYFKKIGLALILASIVIPIVFKLFSDHLPIIKEIRKMIFFDLMILGSCLIIMSRDKIEDEMTIKLKLAQFVGSFFFAVIYVIIYPILNLVFDGIIEFDLSAEQIILLMCLNHLFMRYINGWIAKFQERKGQNDFQ